MLITESTAHNRKKSAFLSCFIKHRFKVCIFENIHAYPGINKVYA